MSKRKQPVKNLSDLRYKMAEKFADLENGEITVNEAKAFSGIASVIVNSVKVELLNNQLSGITKEIDFLQDESKQLSKPGLSIAEAAQK